VTVRDLVADDVGHREIDEKDSVAVAVDHPGTVPEGVVEVPVEVDDAVETFAVAVDRAAAEDGVIEVVHAAAPVEGLIDLEVAAAFGVLVHHERAGQLALVFRVVDAPALLRARDILRRDRQRTDAAERDERPHLLERGERVVSGFRTTRCDLGEDVVGDDPANVGIGYRAHGTSFLQLSR
jgi:hypothetical protein